jgi:hypothetical protein
MYIGMIEQITRQDRKKSAKKALTFEIESTHLDDQVSVIADFFHTH